MQRKCIEIKCLRTHTNESSFKLSLMGKLFYDNTVSNTWAETLDSIQSVKHIDLKYCFFNKSVNEQVDPVDIDSADSPADGMTKPLMKAKFKIFRDMICANCEIDFTNGYERRECVMTRNFVPQNDCVLNALLDFPILATPKFFESTTYTYSSK